MVGYAQAGKDTFAGYLGYRRLAFADVLKNVALGCDPIIEVRDQQVTRLRAIVDHLGWEYAKSEYPEVRRFLQLLGTEGGRAHLGENVWVDAAFKDYDPGVPTVFTDVRFPNEIQAIRDRGGIIVRIDRAGHKPVNGHVSEFAWQATEPDEHFVFDVGAFHHMKLVAASLDSRLRG
jgi:hypothetical protein